MKHTLVPTFRTTFIHPELVLVGGSFDRNALTEETSQSAFISYVIRARSPVTSSTSLKLGEIVHQVPPKPGCPPTSVNCIATDCSHASFDKIDGLCNNRIIRENGSIYVVFVGA